MSKVKISSKLLWEASKSHKQYFQSMQENNKDVVIPEYSSDIMDYVENENFILFCIVNNYINDEKELLDSIEVEEQKVYTTDEAVKMLCEGSEAMILDKNKGFVKGSN